MSGWRDRLLGKQPVAGDGGGNTIHVTMVDAATDQVLGEADLEQAQLPDSFDLSQHATTMHIGSDDWDVEYAEPTDRAGYVASGRLHLVLRKVELVSADEILFSLPTIVDALPPVVAGDVTNALALHEDDWRQREFVATNFRPEIAAEFDMIRAARDSRIGVGYKHLHVRERIAEPLAGVPLQLAAVRAALGDPAGREVALGGGLVVGGYAFDVAGGHVYGREEQGRVVTLAMAQDADPQSLAALAVEHALVFVDWVRTEGG